MHRARALCLDLDDTLWELAPVLRRADEQFHGWLSAHYPRIAAARSVEGLRALRAAVVAELPQYQHNPGWLRRELYRRLARESGYPDGMVEVAFTEFQRLRNQVTLFEDVLPALERLQGRVRLVALTNGNADLDVIGLADHFEQVFTAAQLGIAKPDARVFDAVCRSLDLPPAAVVHAGNDPDHDVAGARAAGLLTVWVNRTGMPWPEGVGRPDHEVRDLHGLVMLLAP